MFHDVAFSAREQGGEIVASTRQISPAPHDVRDEGLLELKLQADQRSMACLLSMD